MSLPSGAVLAPGEYERIQQAVEALKEAHDEPEKFPHPARELSVKVVLREHREFPKVLYKGKGIGDSVTVHSPEQEKKAREDGYGKHSPDDAKAEAEE